MGAKDCVQSIRTSFGQEISDDEVLELLEVMLERSRAIRRRDVNVTETEANARAAEDLARELERQALIEKRNTIINERVRQEGVEYLRRNWMDRPDLGLESFLVGTNVARSGSRASVAAEQKQLIGQYLSGVMNDLERSGYWAAFTSGEYDQDIARALWQLNSQEPDLSGLSRTAVDTAKVLKKWQDKARIDANKAGADIGKLDNYIVRQTHDPWKLRRNGMAAWKRAILPRLDPRTFPEGVSPDEFLEGVYTGLSSGIHMKHGEMPKFVRGPASLAKRLSQERVLHFKSADDWMAYNREFGYGSVRETYLGGLERMGEKTALMRKLGTNPENNWNQIVEAFREEFAGNDVALRKISEHMRGKLQNRFRTIDGSYRIPVNETFARVSSVARSIESMAKLGGATISAISDLPIAASELSYQGQSFFGSLLGMMNGMLRGRPKGEQKEILSSLGVFMDSMRGEAVHRFSADDSVPGSMARLQQTFFKWNGLTWWTETARSSAALMMSHHLAFNARKPWGQLGELQRALSMYGIDEAGWDVIRASRQRAADGRNYITPENVEDPRLADALRTYFTDRATYAVIEPDARTRAMMLQGSQPGTVTGELLRAVGQFKAFPIAVIQKSIGRELYGRGYTPSAIGSGPLKELMAALKSGNGEMLGLAQLMVWTTAFGYLAMSAKEMLKGRNPRDPSDPSTWAASFIQGGGAGIFGDFLFGEFNRFGGGLIQTSAGPVLGGVEDLVEIFHRVKNGDDAAAASFRFALQHTPFINLFYTRIVLDYLFFYQVAENLNPGYLRRLERRVKTENDQTFWLRPTEAAGT